MSGGITGSAHRGDRFDERLVPLGAVRIQIGIEEVDVDPDASQVLKTLDFPDRRGHSCAARRDAGQRERDKERCSAKRAKISKD